MHLIIFCLYLILHTCVQTSDVMGWKFFRETKHPLSCFQSYVFSFSMWGPGSGVTVIAGWGVAATSTLASNICMHLRNCRLNLAIIMHDASSLLVRIQCLIYWRIGAYLTLFHVEMGSEEKRWNNKTKGSSMHIYASIYNVQHVLSVT
jgi:hypothetical protein